MGLAWVSINVIKMRKRGNLIRVHEERRKAVAIFGVESSAQFELASSPWMMRPWDWKEHFEIQPSLKLHSNGRRD
ncbi:hypothetical protein V6N12_064397 [Hibiscus sabdariffa]|uniref:Uncharacterized protein n=1 Tax=Hibiscus sabdariffa TaxID=183260 RepID=A0ABR2G5S0_9ROSI